MNVIYREIRDEEISLLEQFLYEAIYVPAGMEPVPYQVIYQPDVSVYIEDYGKRKDDNCMVAERNGKVVGAAWSRVLDGPIKGYGNIGAGIPELAISVLKEARGQGIGTELMRQLLYFLQKKGYQKVSLSVQKENYACRMYQKLGFQVVKEQEEDILMVYDGGTAY